MHLLPNFRYGTERYPEKIARRLRAVNVAALVGVVFTGAAAISQSLATVPGLWKTALVNGIVALALAAVPLLHRHGPLSAPVAIILIGYAQIFALTMFFGSGTGVYRFYQVFPALVILVIGLERIRLAFGLAALSIVLAVIVQFLAPQDGGLLPPERLFYGNIVFFIVAGGILEFSIVFYAFRQVQRAEAAVEREQQRSEALLVNILPPSVAERLKGRSDATIADAYPEASILFADMAGSTASASDTSPEELLRFLNGVFTSLDVLVERHGLEKIKTSGDSYVVISGVPEPRADHAVALADLALDMRDTLADLRDPKGRAVPVRIGMASGPLVGGVVGTRRFFYDVYGDAVNTASRMESTGEAGKIQVAPETRVLLADHFELAQRGVIEVRGKGPMCTWFLVGRKPVVS